MLKKIGPVVFVGTAMLAMFLGRHFGYSDNSIYISILAVYVMILTFSVERRLVQVEERVIKPDYIGIIELLQGPRHQPQHKQPKSLVAGGAPATLITSADQILFEDFEWFAAVLNRRFYSAWAVEELDDTNIRGYEGPETGRRYRVWYNACKVGTIQVAVGGTGILKPETFAENRKASIEIDLDYLRFIPFSDARAFLYEIQLMIGNFDFTNGEMSRERASAVVASALGGYLWEAVRNSDFDPSFNFKVEGPYTVFRETTNHWKSNGINPMRDWGGGWKED